MRSKIMTLDAREALKPRTCSGCAQWAPTPDRVVGDCKLASSYLGKPERGLAIARDPGCEWATLETEPSFGCIRWEPAGPHRDAAAGAKVDCA